MLPRNYFTKFATQFFVNRNYRKSFLPLCSKRQLYLKTYNKDENRAEEKNENFKHNQHITSKLKNKTISYVVENDPDKFGSFSTYDNDDDEEDAGDKIEEEYITNIPQRSRKLTPNGYAHLIKNHLNQKEIKEAIDVLEIRMKNDRVQPDRYIFNILISGCAKAGYARKAFQLFNKMKQCGLQPSGGTYTSLFNACANAPQSEDGLEKAKNLRTIMLEKGYEPNVRNYNVMIKAYGRCGDIQSAFLIADEMRDRKIKLPSNTFNFLLQACASDKELGFRHALLIWHKMKMNRIAPDKYSFNLILRCVRDCSIGDVKTMHEVISQILSTNQIYLKKNENNKFLSETNNSLDEKSFINSKEVLEKSFIDSKDNTPNLLTSKPHLGNLIDINEIQNPHDRLLLLGGFSGFLDEMLKYKVTPGIETFTSLLEVIPSTKVAEKKLISKIREIGLKADIDFFNILIKKRSMRCDYEGAKEVLTMIQTAKLHPDIVTYGVLALGCETKEEARELLSEMERKEIRMNIQILGAMLRQGCAKNNFSYVKEIMQITLEEKIRPNEEFLRHLDNFNKKCFNFIENRHPASKVKGFKENYRKFKEKLNIWYEENKISGLSLQDAITQVKGRVYEQFKEGRSKGYEDLKNTELQRKMKIRKYIKKIKIANLKDDIDDNENHETINNKVIS